MNSLSTNDEYERRKERERVSALWFTAGVRARHVKRPPVAAGKWRDEFDKLTGMLGNGILYALIGNRGTGKTQLAVECIRYMCNTLNGGLYTTAMDIFIAIKDAYKSGGSEADALKRFKRPSLLVIDECQERGETDWENRLLTYVIDYRYAQTRDTIIVSNQTKQQFLQSVGSSVASRMQETGGIIECNWPSFRNRKEQG